MNQEQQNEIREAGWLDGYHAAHRTAMLMHAKALGFEDPAASAASLIDEKQRAIIQLREICGKFGDNDWPDDLDLADIIEKHLGDHLFANEPD